MIADLTKNLTEKRLGNADLQAFRTVIFENVDGGAFIVDILQMPRAHTIYTFNRNRKAWAEKNYTVRFETIA